MNLKTILLSLLLAFGFGLSAQPYALLDSSSSPSREHRLYLYDANGTAGIPQDDRLIDSISLKLPQAIKAQNLNIIVHRPIITGQDLSLEISVFEKFKPQDPKDDRFLKTLIWQGLESDFKSLQTETPQRISVPQESTLQRPKMKLEIDTLFRK
jgi:hypothetical protein